MGKPHLAGVLNNIRIKYSPSGNMGGEFLCAVSLFRQGRYNIDEKTGGNQ